MKRFLLLIPTILIINSILLAQNNFRTITSGNWNTNGTWERDVDGDLVYEDSPATATPTNADGLIEIRNTHNVTVTASTNGDQMTIRSGGTLTINGGVTFTAWTGAGDDITVDAGGTITVLGTGTLSIRNAPVPPPPKVALIRVHGILNNAGTISNAAASRLFFEAGSTYDHQHTTSAGVIPSATWNITSTCQVTGYTTNSAAPTGLGQTFGDFIWDIGSSSSFIDLNGALTTVDGDLTIQNNPSSYTYLTSTGNYTLNVGGNFTIDNSYFGLNSTATANINVTGNVLFKDNTDLNPTFDGNTTLNFGGNFEVDAGTINFTYGGAGDIPINVGGDVTISNSPTINNVGTGTYTLTFDGSSTQTYTATQAFPLFDYVLENGSDVNVPNSNYFSGAGDFTLEAGATFGVQDVNGLVTGTTSGNVRVSGTRTYTASANIVYNGSSAQDLGDEWDTGGDLNGVAVNLEIDNASGVTNNIIGTTSVVGVLTLTDGPLNIGNANTFDIKGNFVEAGGVIAGHVSGTSNLIFSGTGTFTGTLDIASPFDLNDLTINRSGTVTLGTELDINGSLSFASTGNLDISGQTLTIEGIDGDITQAGSGGLVSSVTTTNLVLNGTDALTALPFCTTCGTMELNDVTFGRTDDLGSASYTWNSAVTINGDVFLNSGALTHTSGLNMATGSTFNRGASGSISAAPTATTTYNVAYNGTLTTGPELPTVASGDLNNLTVAGDATLDKAIDINGTLTVNSGTLAASTNNVTLSGSSFTVNAGTFTINAANTFTFDNAGTTTMSGAGIGGTQFGNLTIASGATLSAPNANINVSGTWTNNQTFTPNSGTVTFNGGNQNIDPAGQPFNNVDFAGTNTKTLQGALDVNGTLTVNSTLDVGSNNAINVAGSWVNSGTFTPGAGTVTFDGTNQTITSSSQAFFNLTLANSGAKTLGDDLDVNGALTINSTVTLDVGVGANAINLAGNWVNDGTDFNARTGTVTFDGTTTISGSTTTDFHHLTIAGSLTAPGGNLDVTGDWLYSSGSFTNNGGTVRFNAGTNQNITSGAQSFNNVTIDGLNAKTLLDNIDIDGNLVLDGSTLSAGAGLDINLAGNFDASGGGVFTATTGEVIFDGAAQMITSGGESFNDVQFAGSMTKTLTDAFDADGNMDIDVALAAGSNNIDVGGNWDATGGSFTTTGLTTFDGTTQNITSNGSSFGAVTIASTSTLLDTFDANSDLTITSSLSAGANGMNVGGDWDSGLGTFTSTGLVTLDGGAQNITIGAANAFNNLTIDGTSATMQDELDIDGNLIISSTLSAGTDNDILIAGDWTNNGTFAAAAGKVTFDGTSDILGSGNTQFNDIDVTGTSVNVETTHSMTGTLTLSGSPTFDADGTGSGVFTLISSADNPTTDGNVAAIPGTATFDGELTVQRYMSSEGGVWRYISAPVSGLQVLDWQVEFPITGSFTGADDLGGANNPSLYYYDETETAIGGINDGWTAYPLSINTENITPGLGYSAFMRASGGQITIDQRGPINQGSFNYVGLGVLTYNSTGSAPDDGWNLIGNPYPSAIDWDALWTANGGAASNIDPTASVRDNPNSRYATWNANTNSGTNGGTKNIAIAQSFWVHATGSPTLTLTESEKTTDSHEFFLEESPVNYLRITLSDGVDGDETLIHFFEDASSSLDQYDAYKLENDIFNLSTLMDNGEDLVINAAGSSECDSEVALNITNASEGNYSLNFTEFESFLEDFDIMLKDNFTSVVSSIKDNPIYAFEITADANSTGNGRFTVFFGGSQIDQSLAVTTDNQTCIGNNVLVSVEDSQIGLEYQAFIDGNAVSSVVAGDGSIITLDAITEGLSEGDYQIEIMAVKPGCSALPLQQEATISRSDLPEAAVVTGSNVCTGQSATLTASGAPIDGSYNWYLTMEDTEPIDGENDETITIENLLEETTYYVTTVNSSGCESTERIAVTAEVVPVYEITNTINGNGCSGVSLELAATGAPEDGSYNWYESATDTEPISGESGSALVTPILEVSRSYFVAAVNSEGCESLVREEVLASVEPVYFVDDVESEVGCPGQSILLSATGAPVDGMYKWYDTSGVLIEDENSSTYSTVILEESTEYFVSVVNSASCESELVSITAIISGEGLVIETENAFVCGSGEVTLMASGAPEDGGYQWFDSEGIALEGETGAMLTRTVSETTTYSVQSTSSSGCTSALSDVTAEVRDVVPQPAVERDGEILRSSVTGDSYQWYLDNNAIEGGNGNILEHAYEEGDYSVQVFRNGCFSISEPLIVLALFNDLNTGELDLYPNPANDFIRLEFEGIESAKISIYVIEMSGRIIQSEVLNNNAGRIDWQLDTKEYENGVYFVKLADGNRVLTGRFVKK